MRRNVIWLAFLGISIMAGEPPADPHAFLLSGPSSFLELYLKKYPPNLSGKGIAISPLDLPSNAAFSTVRTDDLPPLEKDIEQVATKRGKIHRSGLLTTINYEEYPERECKAARTFVIPSQRTGLVKDIEVRLALQPGKAPMAVALLGFGMRAKSKSAATYQADLFNAGNHVFCTDSIVSNAMNEATGHGVAGNAHEEAKVTARILDAFLSMTNPETGHPFSAQVSSVRLLGTSWGAIIASHLLHLPQAKAWPIDRCLLVSIPVNLRTTSLRLDTFHREDRNRTSIFQLARLAGGFTPRKDDPDEMENTTMRAGVGFVFHGDLRGLAQSNIHRYMPELPARLEEFENDPDLRRMRAEYEQELKVRHESEKKELESKKEKLDSKRFNELKDDLKERQKIERDYSQRKLSSLADWSFKHFVFMLARPYWQIEGDISDIGNACVLLKGAPNWVQVVIANDDPLNDQKDVEALRSAIPSNLTVLPHGGHLGFNGTQWFQAMMAKFYAAK